MSKQTINVGTTANDRKGDSLRAAFQKVNANFTELYTALGLNADTTLNLGAFEFTGSTMSTTDSTAITIDQATTITSNLTVGGDILPSTANGGDLGSSARPWRSLYVSDNTIFIGGNALKIDDNGDLTLNNNRIVQENGEFLVLDNLTDVSANSPSVGDVLTWNGGSWVNGGQATVPTLTSQLTNDSGFITAASIPTDFKGSVFADDSTLMIDAVDNKIYATELTVAVGNFVNVNSNNVDVENINGLASQINFTVGGYNNLVIENNLVTIQNVSLSVAGDITLGGAIRSEDAINIDINLSDSTLRRWRFGEDGDLRFPDNTTQTTAWTGTVTDQDIELSTTGSPTFATIIVDSAGTAQTYNPSPELDTYFTLQGANNRGIALQSTDSEGSTKSWLFNIDGGLTLPGAIRSEGAINIDINLSDSTLRRWQFGEDGDLAFPDGTVQTTAFAGNAATVDITNTNGIDTNYSITFVENRDGEEILRADVDLTFNSATNLLTAGNITTGILKIEDGVHEKLQTKNSVAGGVVTHDCSAGHIFYHITPQANWTVNLTNLSLANGYATAITIVIEQGATGYYPSAVQIDGNGVPHVWQGNTTPTPSNSRIDVVTFSIINDGLYTVLGQLTGF